VPDLMPIEHIPDWEQRLARQDACWQREIIDRPVVCFTLPRPHPDYPWPRPKAWPSVRDRWWDSQYAAECATAQVMNTQYWGDALPTAWPNLGPEVFSAFFGCEMEYGETTSWSIPNLPDWSQMDQLRLSPDNPYWHQVLEMTDALLWAGQGRFYVGITDLHPGADALAAFRDPAQLNLDLLEAPGQVRALLQYVTDTYLQVFDTYYRKLAEAGQAITTWLGIVSTRKWYVPSCDFSCMISKRLFDDIFLPGLVRECRHLEACAYHLDGPGALHHLDSLLEIKELGAIQWVYGSGHGRASDWLPVYHRCQQAGKGLYLGLELDELELFMEHLHPQGLWISLSGVRDPDQAQAVLKRVAQWR